MSVFPQFLQHIQDLGIYVEGYNYEVMYNVMVNNLINNFIPSHNFIYTYAQVEDLYNLLDELLNPDEIDQNESNDIEVIETNETSEISQIYPEDEDWTDEETESDATQNDNIINIVNPNMEYYNNIQIENQNQNAQQQLIHYLNNLNPNNLNNLNMNYNNLN